MTTLFTTKTKEEEEDNNHDKLSECPCYVWQLVALIK